MALQPLPLIKEGDVPKKFSLNLAKPARFAVEVFWESPHDLDGHVLLATNSGNGAKITDFAQVLSTYNPNLPLVDGSAPSRVSGDKRPFMTPCRSLRHSGDARTGIGATLDEVILIDGGLIPPGVNELPIFVTIHPSQWAKFADVKEAGIRIKNDQNVILGEFKLTDQFGQFDAVQMGSLLLGQNGWEYVAAGAGFNGDFNTILSHFS